MGEGVVEPGETYKIQHETRERVITFEFRHLSMRVQKQAMLAYDDWKSDEKTTNELYDQTLAVFRLAMVGWSNAVDIMTGEAVPFCVDDLDRVVDVIDARMLLLKILRNGRPEVQQKKD